MGLNMFQDALTCPACTSPLISHQSCSSNSCGAIFEQRPEPVEWEDGRLGTAGDREWHLTDADGDNVFVSVRDDVKPGTLQLSHSSALESVWRHFSTKAEALAAGEKLVRVLREVFGEGS